MGLGIMGKTGSSPLIAAGEILRILRLAGAFVLRLRDGARRWS